MAFGVGDDDDNLIANPRQLFGVLQVLHATNDFIKWWNRDRTLRFVLSSVALSPDRITFDLAVLTVDCHSIELVDNCFDSAESDPGRVSVEFWDYRHADFTVADAERIAGRMNELYRHRLCPCGEYCIKDDAPECLFCTMTSSQSEPTVFCAVCQDHGRRRHMRQQPCCKNFLHNACAAKAKRRSSSCPYCRVPCDL